MDKDEEVHVVVVTEKVQRNTYYIKMSKQTSSLTTCAVPDRVDYGVTRLLRFKEIRASQTLHASVTVVSLIHSSVVDVTGRIGFIVGGLFTYWLLTTPRTPMAAVLRGHCVWFLLNCRKET